MMMTDVRNIQGGVTAQDDVNSEALAGETFARILPELHALTAEELIAINLEIPSVVATTLGALPEIRALRTEMVQDVPNFDLTAFDKLEDYAIALNYAHAAYLTATQPADDLDAVSTEAAALREMLFLDATALSRRGLVDGNRLKDLPGTNGYKNLATDLEMLASVLRESWTQIEGKSALQVNELDRAEKLGQRLMRIVGLREQGRAQVAAATDLRTRAFTLLARAYDQARRAVTFLRWENDDFDRIAPSLYSGRSNGRKKPPEPAPTPSPAPPAPAVTGAAPTGTAPVTSQSASPEAAANPTTRRTDPFLS
jgi:hypothetical protein